jgi:hypothetical protein
LFPDARELASKRNREFFWLIVSLAISLFSTVVLTAKAGAGASGDWLPYVAVFFLWLLTLSNYAVFYTRVARAHFPLGTTLLSVVGLPSFAALLRDSAKAHEEGTVVWRGRIYSKAAAESHTAAFNSK